MVYIQLAYQGPEARDYLKTRLMEEKDIKPIEESDVPEIEILPQKALDFVGMRKYFSSVVSIGFVRADNLGENEIATLCQTFSSFSHSLLKYASRMPPIPLIGTKLGSFGLLCFVFEKGCDEDMIAFIQEQKHIPSNRRVRLSSGFLMSRMAKSIRIREYLSIFLLKKNIVKKYLVVTGHNSSIDSVVSLPVLSSPHLFASYTRLGVYSTFLPDRFLCNSGFHR